MTDILLYGIIGEPADKLDAKTLAPQIRAATSPLTLRINSPGGFVMEGLAIVAAIRECRVRVTAIVDSLAASMASVIAAACDECLMAEASMLMVHNPWDVAIGDAPELRAAADKLDRLRDQMVAIYGKRSGIEASELMRMLDAETWLDATQAVDLGFADGITPALKIAACAVDAFGFRHVPNRLNQQERMMPPEQTDTAQAVAQERTRISTIMALGTKHRIPDNVTQDLLSRGLPIDQARAAILDHLATEGDRANIGHSHGAGGGHQSLDDPAFRAKAMSDAITAKMLSKPAEGAAAEYRGVALVDMAREHLSRAGVTDVYRMSADSVAAMALSPNPFTARAAVTHTTSDFPKIMQAGVDATLIARYHAQESQLKRLTSERDVSNFKAQTAIRMSGFGSLDRVGEGGEYKNKTLSEEGESFKLQTHGNMINFSRQMLVNDSLGALSDLTALWARAAANLEADYLAAAIQSGPLMSDGLPWFHANHGNLAAAGAAISITSLDAARLAMRSQREADGTLIDVQPKFLVVPVGLQTAAETIVSSSMSPTKSADINPFAGKLEVIADPRLTNPTAWYLFGEPTFSPGFVAVYLNGNRTPFTDSQENWRVDGVEWKVRHDFGTGVLDYRLAYKNPGA